MSIIIFVTALAASFLLGLLASDILTYRGCDGTFRITRDEDNDYVEIECGLTTEELEERKVVIFKVDMTQKSRILP